MQASPLENGIILPPEERFEILDTKFHIARVALVDDMIEARRLRSVASHIHSRDIPFVDYAIVTSSCVDDNYQSLELYASGMWAFVQNKQWNPIGWTNKVKPHHLVYLYPTLKDPDTVPSLIESSGVSLEELFAGAESEEDAIKKYQDYGMQTYARYIAENWEELTEQLVWD